MKKIVFFSTPAFGHILAEEPIIRALVKKGYSVDWYSSKRFSKIIKESGANFIPYKVDFDSYYDLATVTKDFYILMNTIIDISHDCFLEYAKIIRQKKPDLILYDSMCTFAKNIAKSQNIQSICLCSTMAFNLLTSIGTCLAFPIMKLGIVHCFDIIKTIREERRFRRRHDLPRLSLIDLYINRGDLTLVLSPREFQPFAWSFPKSFKFVGATVKDKHCMLSRNYGKYDIYISMGSIFTENELLLRRVCDSKEFKNKKTIINVGKLKIKNNHRNIKLVEYTDQLSLLKNVDLFINHGGIGSVYDSIYMQVPQICVPQQEEQRMMAKNTYKKRVGIYVKHFDPKKINKYIKKLEKNSQNILKYSTLLRKTDGTKNAVLEIEKAIENKK